MCVHHRWQRNSWISHFCSEDESLNADLWSPYLFMEFGFGLTRTPSVPLLRANEVPSTDQNILESWSWQESIHLVRCWLCLNDWAELCVLFYLEVTETEFEMIYQILTEESLRKMSSPFCSIETLDSQVRLSESTAILHHFYCSITTVVLWIYWKLWCVVAWMA